MDPQPELPSPWGINYEDPTQITYTRSDWEGGVCMEEQSGQYRVWTTIPDEDVGDRGYDFGTYDDFEAAQQGLQDLAEKVERTHM